MVCITLVLTDAADRIEDGVGVEKSPKSPLKSAKSLSRSLSKSLSFKKSQNDIEKQQTVFERYPGAFSLQVMQADGKACKNKKGEHSVIFLHVFKTYETPDQEARAPAYTDRQTGDTLGKDPNTAPCASRHDEGSQLQDQAAMMRELMRIEQEAKMVATFEKSA